MDQSLECGTIVVLARFDGIDKLIDDYKAARDGQFVQATTLGVDGNVRPVFRAA